MIKYPIYPLQIKSHKLVSHTPPSFVFPIQKTTNPNTLSLYAIYTFPSPTETPKCLPPLQPKSSSPFLNTYTPTTTTFVHRRRRLNKGRSSTMSAAAAGILDLRPRRLDWWSAEAMACGVSSPPSPHSPKPPSPQSPKPSSMLCYNVGPI